MYFLCFGDWGENTTLKQQVKELVEKKNPDGTRYGDIEVFNWSDYDKLKEGIEIDPLGILLQGKIKLI